MAIILTLILLGSAYIVLKPTHTGVTAFEYIDMAEKIMEENCTYEYFLSFIQAPPEYLDEGYSSEWFYSYLVWDPNHWGQIDVFISTNGTIQVYDLVNNESMSESFWNDQKYRELILSDIDSDEGYNLMFEKQNMISESEVTNDYRLMCMINDDVTTWTLASIVLPPSSDQFTIIIDGTTGELILCTYNDE